FTASRLHVRFEAFDLAVRRPVRVRLRRQRRRSAIAFAVRLGRCITARGEHDPRRLTTRLEPFELRGDSHRPPLERLYLLAVERELLFLTGDGQLARVRGLARLSRHGLAFDQLDAQSSEIGLSL